MYLCICIYIQHLALSYPPTLSLSLFLPRWAYLELPGAGADENVHTDISIYTRCTYVSVSMYTISLSLSLSLSRALDVSRAGGLCGGPAPG